MGKQSKRQQLIDNDFNSHWKQQKDFEPIPGVKIYNNTAKCQNDDGCWYECYIYHKGHWNRAYTDEPFNPNRINHADWIC